MRPPNMGESIQTWAQWVVAESTPAKSADARALDAFLPVLVRAVETLGGELPAQRTIDVACDELTSRLDSLEAWTRDNLPLLALWDALAVQDCPLAFERVKRPLDGMGKESPPRDVSDAHEDQDDWRPLAHDLRAVVDGDDPTALAAWLKTGQDVRALIEVALDRVAHLEDECSESEDRVEVARSAISGNVEELARALWERLPRDVDVRLVTATLKDLDRVDDPLVNGVRSLLAGAVDRTHESRTLKDWCALTPAERNRLVDRTRDALAIVNG